jgi:hypothetical protein
MDRARAQEGQASVELVALLPLLAVLAALAWQAVLAGQAVWLAGAAARSAARARAVGAEPADAARGVLPGALRRGVRVANVRGGGVRVSVAVPAVVVGARLATVRASARFAPQDGPGR